MIGTAVEHDAAWRIRPRRRVWSMVGLVIAAVGLVASVALGLFVAGVVGVAIGVMIEVARWWLPSPRRR